MKTALVSIVVPIYKVEKYLARCVNSLTSQTYKNIEIILVDDGSPDNCPKMCDEYAKNDKRIKVIHKKNGGLSDARNVGLGLSRGEYIAFVDSDDYVSTNFIEVLLDTCYKNGADISCCNFYRVSNGRDTTAQKHMSSKNFTNVEAIRDIFLANSLCEIMTWNKLYRTSLFKDNDIKFPVGKVHEDNFTTYKLLYYANKIIFVNQPLYYYLQRDDSIMGQTFNKNRLAVLDMFSEAEAFFKYHKLDLHQELQSSQLLAILALYNDFLLNDTHDKATRYILNSELKKLRPVIWNSLISKKHKLLYILICINKHAYKNLRKFYTTKARERSIS